MIRNVLISDTVIPVYDPPNHPVQVMNAFLTAYPGFQGQFYFRTDFNQNTYDYAVLNNCDIVIRSNMGLQSAINLAAANLPILTFMPAGSNDPEQVFNSNGILPAGIIVTGAGDDNNETGYDVEFFSPDPIGIEPDLSSFSNGYIAGQIALIADSLNVTLAIARTLAKRGKFWHSQNGYGKIDTAASIAFYPPKIDLILMVEK